MWAVGPDTEAHAAICAGAVRAVLRLSPRVGQADTGFPKLEAMMSKSPSPVLHLRDGEFVSTGAVWLSVLRGRVWVTQADDPSDYFLDSGQAMRLAREAGALVGAEGDAQIMLASAPSSFDGLRARLAAAWNACLRATKARTLSLR